MIDGVPHVLERPIRADVALVYAARADALGNLWYRRTARNFNPLMATAARPVIAEVGEIVAAGGIEPEDVHTPHLYVDLARGAPWRDRRRPRPRSRREPHASCARRGREPRHRHPEPDPGVPAGRTTDVVLHTENGLLGVGPRPTPDEVDPDLIDAAKRPVTALPGAAYFDSADSFAMIRAGTSTSRCWARSRSAPAGDIANWAVPGRDVLGVGGAMDLVVGARRVIVTMTATSSNGEPKIVPECTYPLTARACRGRRDHRAAVFRLRDGALILTELLGEATLDEVAAVTSRAVPGRARLARRGGIGSRGT